jgi:putative transposase
MADPLPEEIDDILWQEACRRAEVIRDTLKDNTCQTTAVDIKFLRDKLGLSRSSVFRLIKQFRENGTTMALVDRKRGRPAGHRALDSQREDMIEKAIRKYYLKPTRPSVSQLVRDIQTDCTVAGLKPPHRRTIETRLNDLDLRQRALRRGEKRLEKKAKAVPGKLRASKPLEIVQIDHTKADIFVVDEETREPVLSQTLSLGKLTLFIDAIIQLVQQIAGKQIDWFCQIDACGSYVQPQFLSMLLKPKKTI